MQPFRIHRPSPVRWHSRICEWSSVIVDQNGTGGIIVVYDKDALVCGIRSAMLGFLGLPGLSLVLAWSLECWTVVSVDLMLSIGLRPSSWRCGRLLLGLLWYLELLIGECFDRLLGLLFLGLLYVEDDIDKGFVVVFIGDGQEGIGFDA